jgi:hypothetical protein
MIKLTNSAKKGALALLILGITAKAASLKQAVTNN